MDKQATIYRDRRIDVFPGTEGGFYASISTIKGEVESYISRSDSPEEALQAARVAIDAERPMLI